VLDDSVEAGLGIVVERSTHLVSCIISYVKCQEHYCVRISVHYGNPTVRLQYLAFLARHEACRPSDDSQDAVQVGFQEDE
jgi:hypothetical protein